VNTSGFLQLRLFPRLSDRDDRRGGRRRSRGNFGRVFFRCPVSQRAVWAHGVVSHYQVILLDTHVLVWFTTEPTNLSKPPALLSEEPAEMAE